MIATLAGTEFLTTNTAIIDSPFMIGSFVVSGLLIAAVIVYFILARKDFNSDIVAGGAIVLIIAVALSFITAMSLTIPVANSNRANLTENIKTVYDIENVMYEDDVSNDKISKASPLTVTVTKDGKAYKVILNQDKNTFEPNLSSYENDSIDIKKLKRDK